MSTEPDKTPIKKGFVRKLSKVIPDESNDAPTHASKYYNFLCTFCVHFQADLKGGGWWVSGLCGMCTVFHRRMGNLEWYGCVRIKHAEDFGQFLIHSHSLEQISISS